MAGNHLDIIRATKTIKHQIIKILMETTKISSTENASMDDERLLGNVLHLNLKKKWFDRQVFIIDLGWVLSKPVELVAHVS